MNIDLSIDGCIGWSAAPFLQSGARCWWRCDVSQRDGWEAHRKRAGTRERRRQYRVTVRDIRGEEGPDRHGGFEVKALPSGRVRRGAISDTDISSRLHDQAIQPAACFAADEHSEPLRGLRQTRNVMDRPLHEPVTQVGDGNIGDRRQVEEAFREIARNRGPGTGQRGNVPVCGSQNRWHNQGKGDTSGKGRGTDNYRDEATR